MHEAPRLFTAEQLETFLVAEFDETAANVETLGAGDWSNAFAFTAASKDYVLRIGQFDEDYAKDQIAATFITEGLPIPKFVAMGPAFDRFYAITERATGHLQRVCRQTRSNARSLRSNLLGIFRDVQLLGGASQ